MSNGALPPDAVIKKLAQAGWHIGKRPANDVCPGCQQKQRAAARAPHMNGAAPHAAPELAQLSASHEKALAAERLRTAEALKREHAASLKAAEAEVVFVRLHSTLSSGNVAGALRDIEAQLPHWPWAKTAPSKANGAAKAEQEFDHWLDELQKTHTSGRAP